MKTDTRRKTDKGVHRGRRREQTLSNQQNRAVLEALILATCFYTASAHKTFKIKSESKTVYWFLIMLKWHACEYGDMHQNWATVKFKKADICSLMCARRPERERHAKTCSWLVSRLWLTGGRGWPRGWTNLDYSLSSFRRRFRQVCQQYPSPLPLTPTPLTLAPLWPLFLADSGSQRHECQTKTLYNVFVQPVTV